MNNLYISETFVNRTEGYQFSHSSLTETFTEDSGELFRSLQSEYGKAQKMYHDDAEGTKQIGWVFSKKMEYEDSNEKYVREVWVSLFEKDAEGNVVAFDFSKKKGRKVV